MYERSARAAPFGLFLLLLLASTQAYARKQNLTSGAPFGLGFSAGVERAQSSDFTSGKKTSGSSFGHYFLFQPYFDLVNISFQPYAGWHFYPDQHGTDIDAGGSFTETSSAGNFSYGMRVILSPFISKTLDSRGYFVLGAGMALVKLRNVRNYSNAAGTITSVNTEKVSGSGLELQGGAGMEFFLLQNYSMQIEVGYTKRTVSSFTYNSTMDVTGATRTNGEEVVDSTRKKKGFRVWSPYLQLALNLNF